MKKLLILLALFAGMAFASCDDDEQVLPKSTAEQIAEKIESFMPNRVNVYSETQGSYSDVTYTIEFPFLIIEGGEYNHTYYPLDNLLEMWYVSGTLYLYFE